MGVADPTEVFTSRGRRYRIDCNESMMVHHIILSEIRTKVARDGGRIRELCLRSRSWTADDVVALVPGGPIAGGFGILVQRVRTAMDAGWCPLG